MSSQDTQGRAGDAVTGRTALLTRRSTLATMATAGLSSLLLAACGDEPSAGAASEVTDPTTSPPRSPSESPSSSVEPSDEPSDEPGADPDAPVVLASTGDIPVGGGVIYTSEAVVVTQPRAGDFKCFSAVCTHTGCLVGGVGATIVCGCHGSSFDIATGEVLGGPAPAPLPAVDFRINKDQVVLS